MRAQKKLSEEEIDRQLIEDAANPDAWEPAITVTPVHSRARSSYRKEMPIAVKSGASKKQKNR